VPELADRPEQWPVEDSDYRYDGGGWVVKVRDDRVRRPGSSEEPAFSRLVIEHPGAAIVLAVDDRERVLCLWQYRHAVAHTLVQLPAGLCDVEGEEPAEVARRELAEEAGLEAEEWTHLASTYSSPGFSSERSHYFVARGLRDVGRGGFEPEHEEAEMETGWVAFDELHTGVVEGRFADAHLTLAVLLAAARGLAGSALARE
jgi:8-oxo-dGDP phosphatase